MNEHKTDLEILKKLEEKLRIKFELTDIENFNDIEISLTPKSYYFVENENITAIKIHDINLKTIPKEITKLKNLKVLDLTFNKITEIPKEIAELKNLKVLYLSNNQITEIPKEIAELKNLKVLDLNTNQIIEIPKEVAELKNLEILDLSFNKITEIPKEIAELKNLKILYLSSNQIMEIPKEIAELKNLKILYLSNNQITEIPKEIAELKNLERLDFGGNQITEIPKEIAELKNLKELVLIFNKITEIPKEIAKLKNLERLDFGGNQLTEIPKEIAELKNLERLDFGGNQLTEIPKEIAELKNLKILYLSNNQITEIPKEIAELKNLERLDLSYNKINKINKVLLELNNKILKKLKNCVLFIEDASVMKINLWEKAENTFSDRGKLIVSVPSRTKCQIKKIKLNRYFVETDYGAGWVLSSIVKNKNWLDLSNNPIIKSNLDEIKKLDIQELLLYLLKIQEGSNKPLNEVKILVVGDERVGKTSLINRIIPENSYNRNQESTKGIDIQQHKLKNGIKANIWDFAGQEITHQTHKFFLSTRSLYLLVIDAQKEDNDSGIYDWLETIKSYSNNSPVIIAVNKIDTKDNYKEFDEFRYKRNFNIVDILYTSAEKETNIDKLIDSINKNTENIKDVKKEFPKEWFKIKEELEIFSESNKNYIKDHIEKSKFENICETYNVKDEAEQNTLLKILNEIGTVVSYKKSDHIVIINPMWITNAVYKVIRSELIKDGVLTNQDLDNLFKNDDKYKKRHYKWIMDLLNQFELSFQIEKNKILIPAKLSLNQPALNLEKYQEGLNFRYKYESKLKKNIISHFIVKINRYIDNTQKIKYWRRGVFLEYKNNKTIVISEEEKNIITIAIEINNKQGKEFLTIIREYFKEINENLKVIEEVPLILNNKIVGYKSYKYLENLENQNIKKQYFEIQINGEDNIHEFDISELLNGYKYESSREGGNMGNKILVKGDYHENKTIINQTHNGHGDNVAGNKIINNKLEEFTKLFEEFKEELKKSDKLEENSELLNNIELYVKDGKKNKMLLNILTGALGGLSASGISLLAPQIGELLTKLF